MRATISVVIIAILSVSLRASDDSWTRTFQIANSAQVRVTLLDGSRHSGEFRSADAESIGILENGTEFHASRVETARVEVKNQPRRLRSLLIGAAIGAALGAVGAVATCPSCVGEQSSGDFNTRIAGGIGIGAGIGAALALTGSPYNIIYRVKGK